MARIVLPINLALRFALELVGIVALAFWGYQTGSGVASWVLAILAPAVLIAFWAVVVAPKARNRLDQDVRVVVGSVALLLSAALLLTVGQPVAALVFGAVIVVNTVLLLLLRG